MSTQDCPAVLLGLVHSARSVVFSNGYDALASVAVSAPFETEFLKGGSRQNVLRAQSVSGKELIRCKVMLKRQSEMGWDVLNRLD